MTKKKNFAWMILMIGLLISLGFMSNSARAKSADLPRGEMRSAVGFDYELVTVPVSNDRGEMSPKLLGSITTPADAGCILDTTGAISYWQLDEGAGETTFVDSIEGHNGTCSGPKCPTNVSGVATDAQFFMETEADVINVPSTIAYDWTVASNFSVGMWVKTTQDCTGNKVFVGRHQNPGEQGAWWVGCVPGGVARFRLRDSDGIVGQVTGSTVINDGKWHYITGVRVGVDPDITVTDDDKNLIYVDGVLEGTITPVGYSGTFTSTDVLTMGAYDETTDYYFNGALDEVVIFGTVWDPAAYYGTCTFDPVVTNPGPQFNHEGDVVSLQIVATDANEDPLEYTASELPPGLSIGLSTGLIDGIIGAGAIDFSPYSVTVTVTDIDALSDQVEFDWVITDENLPPEIDQPDDQLSNEGQTITPPLQIVASDPDRDTLAYSALGLPGDLTIDPVTGLISGTIAVGANASSPYSVTVTVEDPDGLTDSASFSWTVMSKSQVKNLYLPLVTK